MTVSAPASMPYLLPGMACAQCGFMLWLPLETLRVSTVGLYDDNRFPGRSLLALDEHYTDLLDVPDDVMRLYLSDLRDVRTAIAKVTGAPRINYAVLGNAEPHVHWHVIPRHPTDEPLPSNSPWQDPRPKEGMPPAALRRLASELRSCLSDLAATNDHGIETAPHFGPLRSGNGG